MFTDEEAQKIIALIYGDKPSKEIHPEDIETHYTKKAPEKLNEAKEGKNNPEPGMKHQRGKSL